MDLASGYSDSINYGNGYTPLANNAIANNNSEYARNQAAIALMAQQAQNNVFASGGGFGAQTAAYAGLGADYGRAVGGGGNIYASPGGGGGGGQSVFETGADPYQDWLRGGGYSGGGGGIGSDAARAPNQPGNQPQPMLPNEILYGRSLTGIPGTFNSRFQFPPSTPDVPELTPQDFPGWTPPQSYSGGNELPPFWQGVRDWTGMGQPGQQQPAWNPWGNTGQQGVTDPMGYGSGGYQGNAIPQQNQNRAPVQGAPDIGPFWQGMRDYFGADPKDQSRVPQSDGGYPGMTNPNYQPGGMTPQQPWQVWQPTS